MQEEIIIDGVNVAGCEHYCEKINTGSGVIQNPLKQGFCLHNITGLQNADIYFRMLTFPKCREQSNCYYKQLKRLEQERDELKKACEKCKLLDIEKTNRDLLERIDKLEQENKELKEENIKVKKEFNNLIAEIISDIEYTGEIACNGESPKEHLKKCQKALSSLEEIREIAKDIIENDVYENSDAKAEKILTTINEVLQ